MVQACLAFPTDKNAYSQLSSLLTVGNLRAEKGECHLYKADVYTYAKGSKFAVVPPAALNQAFDFEPSFKKALKEYGDVFGENLYLAASRIYCRR